MPAKKQQSLFMEFKSIDDANGEFQGYVSVFNNVDFGGDVVAESAFDAEIANNPNKLYPLLHSHDSRRPCGGFKILKDNYGLKMNGFFDLNVKDGAECYSLAKKGVMTGFSIGYSVKEIELQDDGTRVLKEINLYEGSIVVFPMNDAARLTGIKQLPETERDFEAFLRDAGYSRSKAKAITGHGFKALSRRDAEGDDLKNAKDLKEVFARFNVTL